MGTILIARLTSLVLHCPFSRPRAIPILFNTSISSCISKVLSKLNKYSYLEKIKHEDELLFVQQTNGIYFYKYKLRAIPVQIIWEESNLSLFFFLLVVGVSMHWAFSRGKGCLNFFSSGLKLFKVAFYLSQIIFTGTALKRTLHLTQYKKWLKFNAKPTCHLIWSNQWLSFYWCWLW